MTLDEQCLCAVAPVIAQGQCIGCAICVDVCPSGALAMGRRDLVPRPIPGRCTACRLCEQECPTEAISLPEAG
jgi:2-oxoglutarate ferredoxin oxidoreductase subunit delta